MKVEKLIPEVYYSQSRDFSYIGRLLEILFNYMKTAADCVSVNPDSINIDATTIELIALTLGFESKHKYTTRDLIYVISSFSHLIKKKGTKEAINNAIKLLMNSQKIKMTSLDEEDFVGIGQENEEDRFMLNIKIPSQMTDTILLEDIFDYILPAGVLYKFNRITTQPKNKSTIKTPSSSSAAFGSNYDTSLLLSDVQGGYAYILLTDEPSDWEEAYENYYIYDSDTHTFMPNEESTYAPNTFYAREQNIDIGTIITGSVAEK